MEASCLTSLNLICGMGQPCLPALGALQGRKETLCAEPSPAAAPGSPSELRLPIHPVLGLPHTHSPPPSVQNSGFAGQRRFPAPLQLKEANEERAESEPGELPREVRLGTGVPAALGPRSSSRLECQQAGGRPARISDQEAALCRGWGARSQLDLTAATWPLSSCLGQSAKCLSHCPWGSGTSSSMWLLTGSLAEVPAPR